MSLIVVQLPSMGSAYLALSVLSEVPGALVYEMIPHGYGATLLVKSQLELVEKTLKDSKIEFSVDGKLNSDDEKVLRALYSIDNSALKEALLVIESVSPGILIELAQQGVEAGLEIVDLKIPRAAQVVGSVLLTGPTSAIEAFQKKPEVLKAKVQSTFVQVTSALEKFFDISPK
jgi:hypothetical protein